MFCLLPLHSDLRRTEGQRSSKQSDRKCATCPVWMTAPSLASPQVCSDSRLPGRTFVCLALMDVGGNVLQAASKTVTKDIDGDRTWLIAVEDSTSLSLHQLVLGFGNENERDRDGRQRYESDLRSDAVLRYVRWMRCPARRTLGRVSATHSRWNEDHRRRTRASTLLRRRVSSESVLL